MAISVVLLDLDGVIRHFDPEVPVAAERRHGLEPGSLVAAGVAPELMTALVIGRITRAEWIAAVGRAVGSMEAATEWGADTGTVDPDVLQLVDELRSGGTTVAILTNGTDTVRAELITLGVEPRVDAIFNSAEIGVAKPDIRAFRHVTDTLGVAPGEVFFTDDSADKLTGADELGMSTHHFCGLDGLRAALAVAAGAVAQRDPERRQN